MPINSILIEGSMSGLIEDLRDEAGSGIKTIRFMLRVEHEILHSGESHVETPAFDIPCVIHNFPSLVRVVQEKVPIGTKVRVVGRVIHDEKRITVWVEHFEIH